MLLAERALVEQLPPGTALLSVPEGPNQGSRFRLDKTSPPRAAIPRVTSSSTTSPCRAGTWSSTATAAACSPSRDVGSLNGTYVNRERIEEVPLHGGRRGADRQVPAGVPDRGRRRRHVSLAGRHVRT